jgi:hypothetical protein
VVPVAVVEVVNEGEVVKGDLGLGLIPLAGFVKRSFRSTGHLIALSVYAISVVVKAT